MWVVRSLCTKKGSLFSPSIVLVAAIRIEARPYRERLSNFADVNQKLVIYGKAEDNQS